MFADWNWILVMDGAQRGQFVLRLSPQRAGYWGRNGGIPSFVTFKERSITNYLGFLVADCATVQYAFGTF